MLNRTPYHVQVIREALSARQRINMAYSMRAFARDMKIDASTLSQVLKGRRPLPLKNCPVLVQALRLSPIEKTKFMESAFRKRALLDQLQSRESGTLDSFIIDESNFRVIAEWEHYAILAAFEMSHFRLPVKCAEAILESRFGIPRLRSQAVLQNLLNANLIVVAKGIYKNVHSFIRTTDDIVSLALTSSHKESLEIAKVKLDSIGVDSRDFTSLVFAFDPDQMVELKGIVREFRHKVLALAKLGKKRRSVYQLAIQAYPLTKIDQTGEKK